jgi:small GTP-binding protein
MITKCKLIFLGSSGVGKTSLVNRYTHNTFDKDYSATVGIDFVTKPIQVGDRTVNLQIWDTAGQERFRSLIPLYVRESSIAIIVYDVSNLQSFAEAKDWHQTVLHERGSDVFCVLVGNKNDLETRVPPEDVATFTKPLSMATIETCAKTGHNVSRLFKIVEGRLPEIGKLTKPDPIEVIAQSEVDVKQGRSCPC